MKSSHFYLSADYIQSMELFVTIFLSQRIFDFIPSAEINDDAKEKIKEIDYLVVLKDFTDSERVAFSVFMNNLVFDKKGKVLNFYHALERASLWTLMICCAILRQDQLISTHFEDWEFDSNKKMIL